MKSCIDIVRASRHALRALLSMRYDGNGMKNVLILRGREAAVSKDARC